MIQRCRFACRLQSAVTALVFTTLAGRGLFAGDAPLVMLVMDPLAKQLACTCIQGFAQRDYNSLAKRLEQRLGRAVKIEYSDNLGESLAQAGSRDELLLVGKYSVIRDDAAVAGLDCRPVASLTGPDGSLTLTGCFVAKTGDPAAALKDLTGRRVFFGPASAAEKHSAALAALRAAGVVPPAALESRDTCTNAVLDMLDDTAEPPPVAVISSYALALLEGCGTVAKGSIKIIGRTEPVPFVTVFVAKAMPEPTQRKVLEQLLATKDDAELCTALESKDGFRAWQDDAQEESPAPTGGDWPDWRGARRDGRVPWLPERLPDPPRVLWRAPCPANCLAGLSVAGTNLIVSERDLADENDVVRCLDAGTGKTKWRVEFPATGNLDYGQSPRATPVVRDGKIHVLGAFGDLRCLDLTDGKTLWHRHLARDFGIKLPQWGTCATPLLCDGLLVVNPGAPDASVVALDAATGETRWRAPGPPAAYGSFIRAELGGRAQIVGHDQKSLGAWDPRTGERLWRLIPEQEGDFNVPTPLAVDGRWVVVATENNGTRSHAFDDAGRIIAQAAGQYAKLAPDTATPVAVGTRVFGTHRGIHCLDVARGLQPVWTFADPTIGDHASLFASDQRVLIVTLGGELILLDARADECRILSRQRVFADEVEIFSHPALAGSRLFLRGGTALVCLELRP